MEQTSNTQKEGEKVKDNLKYMVSIKHNLLKILK